MGADPALVALTAGAASLAELIADEPEHMRALIRQDLADEAREAR